MGIVDKFRLNNKIAVVTGGAQGIGQTVAIALADAGADVAIFDVKSANETVAKINELGRNAMDLVVDVTDPKQVTDAFDKVKKKFATVDILFNNAGISIWSAAEEMTFETWRKVLSVNLDGAFLVAQAAGKIMLENKKGSIINMASMSAGIVNTPQLQVNYNTSKAGVLHMTRTMACEWALRGVRVNCISPGYVATPMSLREDEKLKDIWKDMTPMKRMCKPEELPGAVIYLAGELSGYTTGSNIIIDGGYSCW